MKKILFLIHDLSVGGAEKVLVNLVNHMDKSKYDITVMTLFDVGVNKQFLLPHIHYKSCFKKMFKGNSHFMKLLSPTLLHKLLIKENYDIEISYLEGPSARIISGCPNPDTKLISWIHIEQQTKSRASNSFRNYAEAEKCYNRFDKNICVSESVKSTFLSVFNIKKPTIVLYNTVESDVIIEKSKEEIDCNLFSDKEVNICGVGKIIKNKGFDRLVKIQKRLVDEGFNTHFYALGVGNLQTDLEKFAIENGIQNSVTFLGYQTNPYKYVAKCDLFVCASYAEGFSTAATEALIVGTPVCTVDVSGMKEMLGYNNEYGIVTKNDDENLYQAIKDLVINKEKLFYYKNQANLRGKIFSTEKTVKAVEDMLESM